MLLVLIEYITPSLQIGMNIKITPDILEIEVFFTSTAGIGKMLFLWEDDRTICVDRLGVKMKNDSD